MKRTFKKKLVNHSEALVIKRKGSRAWFDLKSTPLPETPILNYSYRNLFSKLKFTNFAWESNERLKHKIKEKKRKLEQANDLKIKRQQQINNKFIQSENDKGLTP